MQHNSSKIRPHVQTCIKNQNTDLFISILLPIKLKIVLVMAIKIRRNSIKKDPLMK
jgi:hypothetical protein